MLQDYFRYNDWANQKILDLCAELPASGWDAPVSMGFGSLRATVHHLLAADELWQERIEGRPWQPLLTEPGDVSLEEFRERYQQAAARRWETLRSEQSSHYTRVVEYMNSERQAFSNELGDILLHLANHAVHHRAQILNMAKRQGRALAGGLDYLIFRLAHPTVALAPAARQLVKNWNLEVGETAEAPLPFDVARQRQYMHYGEWATDLLLTAAADLSPEDWDRSHPIGPGSICKTLTHLIEAEEWWLMNFAHGPGPFPESDAQLPPAELQARWRRLIHERKAWLQAQTAEAWWAEPVTAQVPGGEIQFRRAEALLQMCEHGTHHRAQVVNMFRHSGVKIPHLDLIAWLRLGSPRPHPL